MSSASVSTSRSSGPGAGGEAVAVRRVRFADDSSAPAPDGVLCRFVQPRAAVAVHEDLGISDLLPENAATAPEPGDCLDIVLTSRDVPAELRKKLETWLAPCDPQAAPALAIELDGARVMWRAGKAWVQGSANRSKDLPAALIDFAFYEGELRRLEQALLPYEATGSGDADVAFRIRSASRADWERFGRTVESLARMRLIYARLEPQLYLPPRALPPVARKLVSRLRVRADVSDRLEALNDRLEACEDLYEGAVDRITDYRLYEKGLLLEVIIVVLLAIEAVLLAWEFWHRR